MLFLATRSPFLMLSERHCSETLQLPETGKNMDFGRHEPSLPVLAQTWFCVSFFRVSFRFQMLSYVWQCVQNSISNPPKQQGIDYLLDLRRVFAVKNEISLWCADGGGFRRPAF